MNKQVRDCSQSPVEDHGISTEFWHHKQHMASGSRLAVATPKLPTSDIVNFLSARTHALNMHANPHREGRKRGRRWVLVLV